MKNLERYEQAVSFLPPRFRAGALAVEDWQKCRGEEFRLRVGKAVTLLTADGEIAIPSFGNDAFVTQQDLEKMLDVLTEYSRYACADTLRQGYLPLRGGFRLGICGSGVIREGRCAALRDISSLALRIPCEIIGVAEAIFPKLFDGRRFQNTLVVSLPGGGKTTLMRDLIRILSSGTNEHGALRVGVVDERGELAAVTAGEIQMSLGPHTDVLDGVSKIEGIPMLLRVMNPQVVAVDEIATQEDIACIQRAANCGVSILASMHAMDFEELRRKSIAAALAEEKVFSRVVEIYVCGAERRYAVKEYC